MHRKLRDRWAGLVDDLTEAGKDDTRSGVDMSLAALLKIAGFDRLETGLVLCAFPHGKANGDEWLDSAARLRHVARCAVRSHEPEAGDRRPTIRIVPGGMPGCVDRAEQALLDAGLGIYQRGAFLVRPGWVRVEVADGRSVLAQRIIPIGDHALMEAMTAAARWERFDGRSGEYAPMDAPMKVVKAYKDRVGHWRLPVLTALTNAPLLRADGSLWATPGYDAASGLLYDPCGVEFPGIPERPSEEDAAAALELLRGLVATFPFVGAADRAVALSAMLTACARRSLRTAPMHAFTAPTAGSGKSKLVDLCSVIATGREAGVISQGKAEEEMEKRLGALLLAGEQVVAIDNCEAQLGGEFLCQVLTQPVVRARILGRSEAPELPSAAFVTATGNNLVLTSDLPRRAVLCRLDPQCERPELRRFAREPVAVAKAGRARYLAAALTVLRAFVVAGRPRMSDPLGSFEEWSGWVRDALLWLGEADPCGTMEEVRSQDPKLDALNAVVTHWREAIGTARVTVRDIIQRAIGSDGHSWEREFSHSEFREALLTVAGEGGAVNGRRLGKWLAANRGRIVAGRRIVQAGLNAGTMTWKLEATDGVD